MCVQQQSHAQTTLKGNLFTADLASTCTVATEAPGGTLYYEILPNGPVHSPRTVSIIKGWQAAIVPL